MRESIYFLNYWSWMVGARIWYWNLVMMAIAMFLVFDLGHGHYIDAFWLFLVLLFCFGILAILLEIGCALAAILHLVLEHKEEWLEESGGLNITPEDFFDQEDW